MLRLLGLLLGIGMLWMPAAQAEPLRLNDAQAIAPLNGYMELFRDPTAALSFEQVRQEKFTPVPGAVSLGYTHDAAWIRFTLQNAPQAQEDKRWLEILFPLLDYVTLYEPQADGSYKITETGDQRPFATRPLNHRNFVFPLHLPDDQPRAYYLRVKTSSILLVRVLIYQLVEFTSRAITETMLFGLYFGILGIILIIGILFGVALREKLYLLYALYAIPGSFTYFGNVGLSAQFLLPDWPWLNNHLFNTLLLLTVPVAALLFTELLQLRRNFPRFALFYQATSSIPLLFIGFAWAGYYSEIAGYNWIIIFVLANTVAVVSLINAWRGSVSVIFYAIGTSVYLLANILTSLRNFALLPSNFITDWALYIGYLIFTLFIMLGISIRIKHIDQERLAAQAAALTAAQRAERELEWQVVMRTHELAQAKDAAESANRAKSAFLTSMSHELRTPLNAILGYASILRRQPAKLEEGTRIIEHSGAHLLGLLNDLLDLAKIEAGKLELNPSPMRLPALLRGVAELMRGRAEEKGVFLTLELQGDLPDNVVADEKRLRQVLLNLLGNAVKFTDSGSVTLRVAALAEDGGQPAAMYPPAESGARLSFSIEDTGIGIPPDALEKIFQPFTQTDTARKRGEGVGLGLDISRRLVALMGGKIEVESRLEQGSRFYFELRLPVTETAPALKIHRAITGYHGPRRHILVADDNHYNLSVLRALLELLGFDVSEANNGAEAVAQVQRQPFDLVLMDLMMPELNGFDAAQQIHALPGLAKMPIVAVSASYSETVDLREFNGFLYKPMDEAKLFDCLQNLLDLEWQYAEPPIPPPTDGEAAIPPATQLQELLDLARLAKISRITEWANALAPEYAAFAEPVRALAREFDSERLASLARRYLP